MSMTLFTFPIKPGKLAAYLSFVKECMESKQAEYKDLLLRYHLNNTMMWHQNFEGKDYVIFIHDMDDDGMEKLKDWEQSKHPFDQWFDKKLKECYDNNTTNSQPVFFQAFDARV